MNKVKKKNWLSVYVNSKSNKILYKYVNIVKVGFNEKFPFWDVQSFIRCLNKKNMQIFMEYYIFNLN